jgi:WD40 repeat protein
MQTFDLPKKRDVPDALQFSPDGRRLVIQSRDWLDVLDTTTGKVRTIHRGLHGKYHTARAGFTADSLGVVYFADSSLHVRELATGEDWVRRPSKKDPRGRDGDFEVCTPQPDGRLIFLAADVDERTVEIVAIDTGTGEQKFAFARRKGHLRELAVSADGKWMAGAATSDLWVWDIGGKKRPNRAAWHVEDRKSPCFGNLALSADGAYVAVGGFGYHALIQAWSVHTREELDLKGSTGELYGGGLAFAPDRPVLAITQIVQSARIVAFWDVGARAELRRYDWGLERGTGALPPPGAIAFSPDGCRCATASERKVVIWDVDV